EIPLSPPSKKRPQAFSDIEKQTSISNSFDKPELTIDEERNLQRRYALCHSYLDRGLVLEAAQELEKIVVAAGAAPIARQAKNLLLKVREQLEGKSKESAETHLAMGKDFFRSGQYDMAENEIKKSIRIRPEYAEAYKDLALLHYNQGRLKEAYEESKRAIALDRGIKEAYIVLGSLYSKKGRIEDAIHVLQKMKDLPGKKDAVTDLANRMIQSLKMDS
ncbi:tetratricopeptide repeat protein, partial [bacterium]|nr:tetratricopeptide repeat protein [bacterium]